MQPEEQPRTIVVLGSTGNQGRGVVEYLLREPGLETCLVRAVTRDTTSPAARQLLQNYQTPDERLSLVTGDVYDPESLKNAFSGAYGVFAVTSEHGHKRIDTEEDMKHELQAGLNIISVAKLCEIQHFVFSSLPNMKQVTGGRFEKLFHMDHKYIIEQWAKRDLAAVTCLLPGFFLTNLNWPQYCRHENGVVRFCPPIPGDKLVQWLDPVHDMGVFAARVFALGVSKTKNKNYVVAAPKMRMQDFATSFSRVTGHQAIYSPTSLDEWADMASGAVGPGFKEDIRQMMEWASIMPDDKICYGALDPTEDPTWEDLGLSASSFEDWLKRTGWTGP
ncbi:uncharacterized protein N7487_010544 [Penicillium crustosum]|uniref:uncharacterized protein n=1 Tax=Penicillium crustosum TaxID=36656 RepID=UPI00238EBAF5|nr:uncharacterized protein N7487_010544 [Penicillium crustosum]KAJ5396241.1 hypothetical protein N7487_010544 [Penicillium crustosum]